MGQREYYARNPRADIDATLRYRQTPGGRQAHRVQTARRRRALPTTAILNAPFPGAHLHHLTPGLAAYVPGALHRSVPHDVRTGEGMALVNARVGAFLRGEVF